jgi:type II restriction enzyme
MDLLFDPQLAASYTSPPQRIRILSEHWVHRQLYCPSCGRDNVMQYGNNSRIADFYCVECGENYELKSQSKNRFDAKLVDGAYGTMMARLAGPGLPNLLLLGYEAQALQVTNLLVVPKQFFIPALIEQRKPLRASARRAGWIGCNILLDQIPQAGRIFLIRDKQPASKADVLAKWQRILFVRDQHDLSAKGWLLSVMRCIEQLGRATFALEDVYSCEDELKLTYPSNQNIRPKIRQQLQVLRNKGYLKFLGNGTYRLLI